MPKIPQATDYGARQSLRSNRIDMPGQDSAIMADALSSAANRFADILVERKQKNDKLNYALAKTKLIQADIEERQKLKDDEDWQTHDERYREAYAKRRDEIVGKYQLDPNDRQIFSAEADLIGERGAVQVGTSAHEKKRDQGLAELNDNLAAAAEEVLLADPQTANDLMFAQLDAINAFEEIGFITDVQAQQRRQGFVSDVSVGRLEVMDPELREEELRKSLAKRKAVGRISREDIQNGKGSGSIADFLPKDVVKKMLDATEKENKANDMASIAYAASDSAFEKFPGLDQQSEREAFLRNKFKGDADKRDAALEVMRQRWGTERLQEGEEHRADYEAIETQIEQGVPWAGLDSNKMSKLTSSETQSLKSYYKQYAENQGFNEFDDWETQQYWNGLTLEEQAAVDFDGFIDNTDDDNSQIKWRDKMTRDWIETQQRKQEIISRSGSDKGPATTGGLTQTQLVDRLLLNVPYFNGRKPTNKSPKEQKQAWSRMELYLDTAIVEAQEANNGQRLTPAQMREVVGKAMTDIVFLREDPFGPNRWRSEESLRQEIPVGALGGRIPGSKRPYSQKVEDAFIPMSDGMEITVIDENTGRSIALPDKLRNIATSQGLNVDDRDIEEAMFYYLNAEKIGMPISGYDAALARLAGMEGL